MVYYNEDGSVTSNAAPRTLIGDNAIIAAKDAEIARLTAERDALNEELREARMQAIADGVQFQMDMEDLTAERDEARAQVAMAFEVAAKFVQSHDQSGVNCNWRGMADTVRALTPADATAALASRDAAMRNEGRRQAVEIARDDAKSETVVILNRRLAGIGVPVAASARRWQAMRTALRILSTLEPEGGE